MKIKKGYTQIKREDIQPGDIVTWEHGQSGTGESGTMLFILKKMDADEEDLLYNYITFKCQIIDYPAERYSRIGEITNWYFGHDCIVKKVS